MLHTETRGDCRGLPVLLRGNPLSLSLLLPLLSWLHNQDDMGFGMVDIHIRINKYYAYENRYGSVVKAFIWRKKHCSSWILELEGKVLKRIIGKKRGPTYMMNRRTGLGSWQICINFLIHSWFLNEWDSRSKYISSSQLMSNFVISDVSSLLNQRAGPGLLWLLI